MNTGFIDLHCHILPGLDEGSGSVEESLRMLQLARSDGISGIVATPHIVKGVYDNTRESIEKAASELNRISGTVRIYTGGEIRIDRDIALRIQRGELPLINGGNHVLLELPAQVIPPVHELEILIGTLHQSRITTIFAHPERNIPLGRNPSIMERLIQAGSLFQATSTSITDPNLHGLVVRMIRKGLIHAVASDAHDPNNRPPILSRAYEVISRKFGAETADKLFRSNPLKIIRGEQIEWLQHAAKRHAFGQSSFFCRIKKALP